MNEFKDDQTNLIALVALFISTAGFRQELTGFRLGITNFTLFTVFAMASILFGILLYFHLLLNAWHLLVSSWRAKQRIKSLITLRLLFIFMLTIIPFSTIFIASSNWLMGATCETTTYDSFLEFPPRKDVSKTTVCTSNFFGVILPAVLSITFVALLWWLVSRRDREWNKLAPELKDIRMQIAEFRMIQAMSSNPQTIDSIQKAIDKLEAEFKSKKKNKRHSK